MVESASDVITRATLRNLSPIILRAEKSVCNVIFLVAYIHKLCADPVMAQANSNNVGLAGSFRAECVLVLAGFVLIRFAQNVTDPNAFLRTSNS